MRTGAVIVAAGRGTRAGGGVPKQWRDLGGVTVAERALRAFAGHPDVSRTVLVVHPDDIAAKAWPVPAVAETVPGGDTRRASVIAGLAALEGKVDRVLIHDAARPFVARAVIDRVLAALDGAQGAAPAIAVSDALWTGSAGRVTGAHDRTGLYRAQTPQGFDHAAILAAHRAFDGDAADDVEVALAAGLDVAIVEGDEDNFKITGPEDFARAERLVETLTARVPDVRTGNGFDVHRFGPGDHVMLCGVRVPHPRGLRGHSDADVGLHALSDAIYGALAEGDIGTHFPPSDPQWKDAASDRFLAHAAGLARMRGFALSHLDVTLICETPKIGAHAQAMRDRVAGIAQLPAERVGVKATTTERLGFAGRGEGVAAMATATLVGR